MKIGVLLSGNGVYDGSEIQEAVFTLLTIDEIQGEAICMAPDIDQHHVLNHISGEEMPEKRNVLIESARIARGNIRNLAEVDFGADSRTGYSRWIWRSKKLNEVGIFRSRWRYSAGCQRADQ